MLDYATRKAGLKPFGTKEFGLDKWNPLSIGARMVQMLEDAENAEITGAGVSAWRDKTGYAHDVLQSVDASRPTIVVPGGLRGHSVIRFNGTDQCLLDNLWSPTYTNTTTFMVMTDPTHDGAIQYIIAGKSSNQYFRLDAANIHQLSNGSALSVAPEFSPSGFGVWELYFAAAGDSKMSYDNVVKADGAAGNARTRDGFQIACRGGAEYSDFDLAAMYTIQGITEVERIKMYRYIAWKFNE